MKEINFETIIKDANLKNKTVSRLILKLESTRSKIEYILFTLTGSEDYNLIRSEDEQILKEKQIVEGSLNRLIDEQTMLDSKIVKIRHITDGIDELLNKVKSMFELNELNASNGTGSITTNALFFTSNSHLNTTATDKHIGTNFESSANLDNAKPKNS